MNQFRCETCEYYPAGSIFDERCPYSEFTWRHAGNHPQCIKDPFLASEIWQVPIDVMSELTSFIGCASHSDFQSGRGKLLDEVRIKYVVFLNHPCPELADKYKHCCDAEWCGLCTLDEVLEELRQAGR